jgi:hypothetical protein
MGWAGSVEVRLDPRGGGRFDGGGVGEEVRVLPGLTDERDADGMAIGGKVEGYRHGRPARGGVEGRMDAGCPDQDVNPGSGENGSQGVGRCAAQIGSEGRMIGSSDLRRGGSAGPGPPS